MNTTRLFEPRKASITLLLAVAAASLCACGDDTGESGPNNNAGNANGGSTSVGTNPANGGANVETVTFSNRTLGGETGNLGATGSVTAGLNGGAASGIGAASGVGTGFNVVDVTSGGSVFGIPAAQNGGMMTSFIGMSDGGSFTNTRPVETALGGGTGIFGI